MYSSSRSQRTLRPTRSVDVWPVDPNGGPIIDEIDGIRLSSLAVPLEVPVSDAKVLTGRQRPLAEVTLLVAEIQTKGGLSGIGFAYSKRAGGRAQYAHALEIADVLIGEDPNEIDRLFDALLWAGASAGRSGIAVQSIAALDIGLYDMKAKRAGLSLAKLLGQRRDSVRSYNTTVGFLHLSVEEMKDRASALIESGVGGLKLKVGHPDRAVDMARIAEMRRHVGEQLPLMVDVNQQWDRSTAARMCRSLEDFGLTWIEEPLDAFDLEGHAELADQFATPIATGEMLTSAWEHEQVINRRAADIIQPDAPRIGGITPYLRVMDSAAHAGLGLAPHFAMEIHIHLAAVYPTEPWLEHFEWLQPVFNESLEFGEGRIRVPMAHGLGLSLSEQGRAWTTESAEIRA